MARRRFNPSTFFARGLLGVVIVGGAIGTVGAVVEALRRSTLSRDIWFGGGKRQYGDAVEAAKGAWVHWRGGGSAGIDHPDLGVALVNAVPMALVSAAGCVSAWLVFLVVINVELGSPFSAAAARRLRLAATIVVGAALLHPFVSAIADAVVFHAATVGETSGPPMTSIVGGLVDTIPWFLVGALLAAFAQAFGEGRRLADETEGLV